MNTKPNLAETIARCYFSYMSKAAIQEVVQALETLPESDQRLVLNFLTTLKQHRAADGLHDDSSGKSSALATKGNLLVFTGRVDLPAGDWVEWEREERDQELMEAALGRANRR
jgi:hypothetical protein